jgi:hypothetical protein
MVLANTSHFDPTGNPIGFCLGLSAGSPSDVTVKIRIHKKTTASITVHVN